MFCPRCAVQNTDNARFCRSCGADISLVPQALTGQLAEQLAVADGSALEGGKHHRRHREKKPATMERAVKSIFIGFGFILVALSVLNWMPGGFVWWFWMLIPAFACLGEGVGTLLRVRSEGHVLPPSAYRPPSVIPPAARAGELGQGPSDFYASPPSSVTEGTTRHLGAPSERAPKDV